MTGPPKTSKIFELGLASRGGFSRGIYRFRNTMPEEFAHVHALWPEKLCWCRISLELE